MDLEQENKQLKEKIYFLETILEINTNSLDKVMETNRMLMEELKKKL